MVTGVNRYSATTQPEGYEEFVLSSGVVLSSRLEEVRRQSLSAIVTPGDCETLEFIQSVADTSDWT